MRTQAQPVRKEFQLDELKAILDRARTAPLDATEVDKLAAVLDTLAVVTQELDAKRVSLKRLRWLLFGPKTEKTDQVLGNGQGDDAPGSDEEPADSDEEPVGSDETDGQDGTPGPGAAAAGDEPDKTKKKRPGHGRNGAAAYRGADKETVSHGSLQHKDPCPACDKGKVYRQAEPAVLVRVRGMAPLMATVYELERLRCNLCGEVFTAEAPPEVGPDKYDETASAMIGLLKYGCGVPFNRLEKLEGSLGIPLPDSTQWDVVERAAQPMQPAYAELIRQAAQGEVVHNDDTSMRILDLDEEEASGEDKDGRTGVFTTGIVSTAGGQEIALFFTGRQHAGENLADVLAHRAAELAPPIQMCDALPVNTAGDFETVVASCVAHGRRRFVEVADSFPDECRHVLEELRKVYRYDAEAKEQGMTPEQRLLYHQEHSDTVMAELRRWLDAQFVERRVEPNSTLGEAIAYMCKHWDKMTLFLREPGAPLDNTIVERALKKAILHRKNAMFYRTENGAAVGDLFMSLIYTAERCGENPFDYLVALQRCADAVADAPGEWMPWSFRETLQRLDAQA